MLFHHAKYALLIAENEDQSGEHSSVDTRLRADSPLLLLLMMIIVTPRNVSRICAIFLYF